MPPTSKTEGTRDAATDSAGNIYTADYRGNSVDVYDSTDSTGATPLRKWGSTVTTDCHNVNKPYGVDIDTVDTPNRIYVASSNLETRIAPLLSPDGPDVVEQQPWPQPAEITRPARTDGARRDDAPGPA